MQVDYLDKLNEQRLFDPNEYFVKGNPARPQESAWISLSVEYQTRLENVKGILTLQEDCILFKPDSNNVYKDSNSTEAHFRLRIDYLDIVESGVLKIPNDIAADDEDKLIRKNYKWNILYNFGVSCVNGLSVIQNL